MEFVKMHGAGNDYIFIDCIKQQFNTDPAALSRRLSDRHKGVGGDGIVLIMKSSLADFRMRMFNADGSEGGMCGNAIRCVGKYLHDFGYTTANEVSIETRSGIKQLTLAVGDDNKVSTVTVDMGVATFEPSEIPYLGNAPLIGNKIAVDGDSTTQGTALSVGNPHLVIPVASVADYPLHTHGPKWEHHPLFPDRVNTEIVEIVSDTHIKMRVWERGSGETFACGTGACASVVACTKLGLVAEHKPITVSLLGGDLTITLRPDNHIIMEGPAEMVFIGELTISK